MIFTGKISLFVNAETYFPCQWLRSEKYVSDKAFCRKPELLKGVYDMGFNAPSKIQETALPTLLADP